MFAKLGDGVRTLVDLGLNRDVSGATDGVYSQSFAKTREWVRPTMLLCDVLMVEIVVGLAYLTRALLTGWLPVELMHFTYAGILSGVLILPVGLLLAGLHPGYGLDEIERLRRRVIVTTVVFAALIAWDYLARGLEWSRGILLISFVYALVLPWFGERLLRGFLIARGCWGEPVIILGANATGLKVARTLREVPELGLVPSGFLDDNAAPGDSGEEGIPILGPIDAADDLCRGVRCGIIALPIVDGAHFQKTCDRIPFADVIFIPELRHSHSLCMSTQDLGGIAALRVKRNLLLRKNRVFKRCVDLVLGLILTIFTAPLIGICALLIKLVDPGPAFYSQQRIGKGGKPFMMIKLRTMYTNADQLLTDYLEKNDVARMDWGRHMKLRNDPRIIPLVGNFLRRSSIDELPQLWHVMTGKMSIIGPRPFPGYHLERFSADFRELRSKVTPGLSGLWQVEGRSDADIELQESLDTYYIKNWSSWIDLYVFLKTIPAVLSGRGAQ